MALSYIIGKVPAERLEGQCTEDAVWQSATLKDAWGQLHELCRVYSERDPARAAELQSRDLPALALCTESAEILHLLSLLPPSLRVSIANHPLFQLSEVEEFFLHLGQSIEVRGGAWVAQLPPPSAADLQHFLRMVGGRFGEDGRGCISNTAHRVAVWRGRQGESLGVTVRVGRYVPNAARALRSLAHKGSVLILSRAGMGKTTLLRDLAAAVAQEPGSPRVTVVDTSNEIGGDSPAPMAFLGRCRRIQVPSRERQSKVMTEVIQNHSPEYLVVDELATLEEAQAAWSIAQRGVRLIATCHGDSLVGLLQNQALNLLVGGAAHAFLSNEERRLRNKTKKTVLERPHSSPFRFVVELRSRNNGYVYVDVNRAVDLVLDDASVADDASVGGPAVLDRPLPARLEKLIAAQDRAAQGRGQRAEEEEEEGEPLRSPVFDDDGYVFDPPASASPAPHGGRRQRSRRTADRLLDDLNRLL